MASGNTVARGRTRATSALGRFVRARSLALFTIALAAVLASGACSSSSSQPSGNSTTAPASGATSSSTGSTGSTGAAAAGNDVGITPTTIRIGVITDIATPVNPGLFQKNANVVKAWAAIVNAHGGLAGRQVAVDVCDSKLDPNATRQCVIKADRKSTRLNSSHLVISYAVFCLK